MCVKARAVSWPHLKFCFELFQALQPISDKKDIISPPGPTLAETLHHSLQNPPSKASIYNSLSFPPIPKPPNSKIIGPFPTYLSNPCPSSVPIFWSFRTGATNSSSSTPIGKEVQKPNEASMSIDNCWWQFSTIWMKLSENVNTWVNLLIFFFFSFFFFKILF